MPSNDVLALEANFQEWQKNRFPTVPKGVNIFEYYCTEQFARSFDLGDSQLKTGMVGAGGDGGVDAFYILANGELVESETELSPKDPPEFKLLIMQIKGGKDGFSPIEVDKLYWFTEDLFDLAKKKSDYHSTYNDDLITLMRLFKDKFGVVVGETPPLSIEYIYVVKNDVEHNDDCQKHADTVVTKCKQCFPHAEVKFRFINAAELWKQVQMRPHKKRTIRWASQPMAVKEGELGLVRLPDYYKFITDGDGKMAERFFDSNVRGYWPSSGINRKIGETLRNANSPEFWLLNNGITVLTEKTETTGAFLELDVHDPQIVNGLQTSRQIYNHFSTNPSAITAQDDRRVLVRIIKSGDKTVRDEVIRCTNSQNEMPEEALRATDAIHRQLEQSFHTKSLYYDRRKGYYRDQGKPVSQIVSVIDVLQAMLAVVLQRPDDARGRPRDYIKKNDPYKAVFGPNAYSLTLYLKATEICRRVSGFLENIQIENTHRRNLYFYLCMYVTCETIGTSYAVPSRIEQIDVDGISDITLQRCLSRIQKKYERLADKYKTNEGRDYDSVAKGPNLLKAVQIELKRRLNPKKKKTTK
jgi:AIPR protein